MRTATTICCLLALAAIGAGCGGTATADSVVITHVDISKRASDLVLDAEDIGGIYVVVDGDSGMDHLGDTIRRDPPAIKQLERREWQSGYHALYASPNSDGVLTDASVFKSEDAAVTVSAAWAKEMARRYHGVRVAASDPNLQHVTLIRARIPSRSGLRTGYWIEWVHGRVIAQILAFGASGTVQGVSQLAQAQDGRITNAE
ncbi:MAG TPA: hypothetical protein VFH74_13630 [Gaiellales bacterium]|jgi:hypothetical protein|nr:hypothetical protein [Gaiellales bacterium]